MPSTFRTLASRAWNGFLAYVVKFGVVGLIGLVIDVLLFNALRVGVALLGVYLLLRTLLGGDSEAVAASLVAVHPTNEIAIQRRVFQEPPPPRPAPQTSRIRAALGPPLEIEHHGNAVTVADGEPVTCAIPEAVARPAPEQPSGRAPAERSLRPDG